MPVGDMRFSIRHTFRRARHSCISRSLSSSACLAPDGVFFTVLVVSVMTSSISIHLPPPALTLELGTHLSSFMFILQGTGCLCKPPLLTNDDLYAPKVYFVPAVFRVNASGISLL